MSIRDQIRDLGDRWLGQEYADDLSMPVLLRELTRHAWIERKNDGPDAELLREAWRRFDDCGCVTGSYEPGEVSKPAPAPKMDADRVCAAVYAAAETIKGCCLCEGHTKAKFAYAVADQLVQGWRESPTDVTKT